MIDILRHRSEGERWHLTVRTSTDTQQHRHERDAWLTWMQINCGDCMCVYRFNNGVDPHWEVRGGQLSQLMLLLMRWG
jgi:hypothetical protein